MNGKAKEAAAEGLSVVVCSYRRYPSLQHTIECLLKQQLPKKIGFEIVIVDNSPDRATARAFATNYVGIDNLNYLVADRPGLSHARNLGLESSRFDLVAFVDDDVNIPPSWAAALIGGFGATGSRVAVVGGRVKLSLPRPKPDWLHDRLLVFLGLLDCGERPRDLLRGENIVGCNMAFNRSCLVAAGGFDTRLGRFGDDGNLQSNEELKVVQRILAMGWRIRYVPDAVLEHIVDDSRLTKSWFLRRMIWQAKSDRTLGGLQLQLRYLRAHLRRAILPMLRQLEESRRRVNVGWLFYLEAEATYDAELLSR